MTARVKVTITKELEGTFEGSTIEDIVGSAELEARNHGDVLDEDIEILECDDPRVNIGIWDPPIVDEDREAEE